jgi:hypothetical protein
MKDKNRKRIIAAAIDMYAINSDDDIEIDEDAAIDPNRERGFWVQARVYVRASDVKRTEELWGVPA